MLFKIFGYMQHRKSHHVFVSSSVYVTLGIGSPLQPCNSFA